MLSTSAEQATSWHVSAQMVTLVAATAILIHLNTDFLVVTEALMLKQFCVRVGQAA